MNWDSIEAVFDRGRRQSAEARKSLLGDLTPEEADEVFSLWASDDETGSFLDTSLVTGPIERDAESARRRGARIAGRFTLVERLGAGGMGEVPYWPASLVRFEQSDPECTGNNTLLIGNGSAARSKQQIAR